MEYITPENDSAARGKRISDRLKRIGNGMVEEVWSRSRADAERLGFKYGNQPADTLATPDMAANDLDTPQVSDDEIN